MLIKAVCKHCVNQRSHVLMTYEECENVWQQDFIYNPTIPEKTTWREWCDGDESSWENGMVKGFCQEIPVGLPRG